MKFFLGLFLIFSVLRCAQSNKPGSVVKTPSPPFSKDVQNCKSGIFFAHSKDCAFMKWDVLPVDTQAGTFTLTFAHADGKPYNLAGKLTVLLTMKSMPHRHEAKVDHDDKEVGVYHVTDAVFGMPGTDWLINITLQNTDKSKLDQVAIPYVH